MEYTQKQADVIEIDLLELFFVLLHRIVWILLVSGIVAGLTFAVTEFVLPPIYESTTKIYILNKQDNGSVTYSDVQIGTQLTKDYAELVKSRSVLDSVIRDMKLNYTYDELLGKVDITTPTDTRILTITVEDESPVLAMRMADKIREVASAHITNVMDIEAVNVVENANLPEMKSKPRVFLCTMIGGLLGALFVCVIVLIRYMMDDTIKSSEDVEKYLQLSTLALIPMIEAKEAGKGKKGRSPAREQKNSGRAQGSKKKTVEEISEKNEILIEDMDDINDTEIAIQNTMEEEMTNAVSEDEGGRKA